MTTFAFAWDATFNSEPADNENINLGAGRIRDTKSAVQARMQVDHSWAGDANDGKHLKSEYMAQTGDPTLDTGDGAVYSKQVGGNTELFYRDSSGSVVQLTAQGTTPAQRTANYNNLPSGTQMLFYAGPPPGWTINTGVNDQMVRLVNSPGGGGGGSWIISGLGGGTTDGYSLNAGEIPLVRSAVQTVSPGTGFMAAQIDVVGAAAHVHGLSTIDSDGSWRPAYVNMVLCVKA